MFDRSHDGPHGPQIASSTSLALGFGPTLETLAAAAAARETSGTLPHAEMATLKALGFGALRLPRDDGGHGLSLRDTFAVARDLATADANLAHALRNHSWQIELALRLPDHPLHAQVLALAAKGQTVGLGFVETDAPRAGALPSGVLTRLAWDAQAGVYRGTGQKVYATGNAFNDAFVGTAIEGRHGRSVQYLLTRGPGVGTEDDWQGFGQRQTGSGTMRFTDVTIPPDRIYPPDPVRTPEEAPDAAPWRFTFHQVWLTNCITGIVRRISIDAVEILTRRGRNFYHGTTDRPADEPVLQAMLGRISAHASALEAVMDRATALLQRGWEARGTSDERQAMLEATLAASEAKVVIDALAPQIAGWLIDLGSGSVVSRDAAYDRHWRNIKVIGAHNPRLYKEQFLGRHRLSGHQPPTGAFF